MAKINKTADEINQSIDFADELRKLKTPSDIESAVDKAGKSKRKPYESVAAMIADDSIEIGEVVDVISQGEYFASDAQAYDDPNLSIQVIEQSSEASYINKIGGFTDQSLSVAVGDSGDFSSINEAINFYQKFIKLHSTNETYLNIVLDASFVMQEQVFAVGVDLSRIKITTADKTTPIIIDRASLTKSLENLDYASTPAFLACNGTLPIIDCLFEMNTTGNSDPQKKHGVMAARGGRVWVTRDSGILNVDGRACYAVNGYIYARQTKWDGAYIGARPGNSSSVVLRDSSLQNCKFSAIRTAGASICAAQSVDISGCLGADALHVANVSSLFADGITANNLAGRFANVSEIARLSANFANIDNVVDRVINAAGACNIDFISSQVNAPSDSVLVANQGATINATDLVVTNGINGRMIESYTGSKVIIRGASIQRPDGQRNIANTDYGGVIIANLAEVKDASDAVSGRVQIQDVLPNNLTSEGVLITDDVIKSSGIATISATSKSVVVNHGLDYPPSNTSVTVIATGSNGASMMPYVQSFNATSFTIKTVNSDASDANFAWSAEGTA